jgi:hypothetical protein
MQRTPILTFSVACLIVSVSCIIAAVIVVQKNDILENVDNQNDCEEESVATLAPGDPCQKWKYNSCMKGKIDSKRKCKVNTDSAAAILMIVALVGTVLWIATLVWGLSLPLSNAVSHQSQDANVEDATAANKTLVPAAEEETTALMG